MFSRRYLFPLTVLTTLLLGSVSARAATHFDAIYVFGDSYCDVGNIFIATGGATPPSPPYFNGRFSNGPLWTEHVASAMGLPMAPSLAGGTDFAFGGAFVTVPGNDTTIPPSIPEQVELYLSQHGGHADPNALYVIEGGGNDILNANNVSAEYLGYEIALGLATSELLLRRAGAKNFLIPDLFDVGQLPAAKANAAFASAATVATNNSLNVFLDFEELIEGIFIHRIDVFSLFHDIAADSTPGPGGASHFGFTDITNPCLNPAPCADPDHTLFWDGEHPTEFGHAFFAVTAVASLGNRPTSVLEPRTRFF